MKPTEYKGKTVFVTGAASGIGQNQALVFLENEASVFAFDRSEAELMHIAAQYPGQFHYAVGDVTDNIAVKDAVTKALQSFNHIDILLNTAGILDGYANTLDTSEKVWDKVMDTNVKGIYNVTNAILPSMLQQKSGVIINMASIAGFVAGGGGAAYTASKHAIIGYTKQLAYDFARLGIRANAIAPGAIQTPMNKADFQGDGEIADWVASETPAGRWAQAKEIADSTLFLASEKAGFMHGAVLTIDGGWTIK